jgi:glycosyltransferase involved in cell wall biosynthesis
MRVLVQCDEVVGSSMAGVGIRAWEISRQLARAHAVTLATPFASDGAPAGVEVVRRPRRPRAAWYAGYDAVVAPTVLPPLAVAKRRHGLRLVADLYDPVILEALELQADRPVAEQRRALARQRRDLALALRTADHVVCASEAQRDLWLGALMTAGRLTPELHHRDPRARELVGVVAFGLPAEPPARTGPGLRARLGLAQDDLVLLWGGGVWSWLDPLTLIESVGDVVGRRPGTKLVFMGLEHPNEEVPVMPKAAAARRHADELGLTGAHVFFNAGWVPYDERQNVLLDADVGVSVHADHLETRFAFRTRNLDYLWAGLPVLTTQGDVFAGLVERSGAGLTVPAGDRAALAAAIEALHDRAARRRMAQASRTLAGRFAWPAVVEPLEAMLDARSPVLRPGRATLARATGAAYGTAALNRARRLTAGARR